MTRGESSWRTEFSLALECCKWGFRGDRPDVQPLPAGFDWSRFSKYVAFHRIEGLAAAFLAENETDAPPEVCSTLSEATERIAARNLEATVDCRAIRQSFEAAGIPLLFLKGLSIGALAYRNPLLKAAIDVDLLIDPKDLSAAAVRLRQSGYALDAPRESPDDAILKKWHSLWKESVWVRPGTTSQIDLHTRLTDHPRLISRISVHSPRQVVDVGNHVFLPTLAPEESFAYLAVHGASSSWFRLKWIADFAALLHGRVAEEIEYLYRRSQNLGAGRAPGQALLLADELFGTLESAPSLRRRLLDDGPTRRHFLAAVRLLTIEPREPTAQPLTTLGIRWRQLHLLPGPGYKLSEFAGQLRRILNPPPA